MEEGFKETRERQNKKTELLTLCEKEKNEKNCVTKAETEK